MSEADVPESTLTRERRFHLAMAVAMMALMVLGFARTFFLRPFFDTYEVPRYVLFHGIPMTLWFVAYVIQSALAARGQAHLHRRFGVIGAAVGLAAILSSALVALGMVTRLRVAGRDIESEVARVADVVWTNMSSICVFAGFFGLALALRRRRDFHSRLMVLATIGLLGPALARAWVIPSFEVWPGMNVNTLVFYYGARVALLLALVVHDWATARRLHLVTWTGIPVLFGSLAWIQKVMPTTDLGQWVILQL